MLDGYFLSCLEFLNSLIVVYFIFAFTVLLYYYEYIYRANGHTRFNLSNICTHNQNKLKVLHK